MNTYGSGGVAAAIAGAFLIAALQSLDWRCLVGFAVFCYGYYQLLRRNR